MFDYNEQIQHGVPFSLTDGLVTESNIIKPYSSFWEEQEYYQVTLIFPDSGFVNQIEQLFQAEQRTDLEHLNPWKIDDYTIRASSLVKPKTNGITTEIGSYGLFDVRVKTACSEGNAAVNNQLLIVMISAIEDLSIDDVEIVDGIDI